MSGYIGNIPVPQATQTRQSFTATAAQTTFNTAGYSPGYIDVFLNGVKLAPADYTATNGSDVILAVGAASGDILETVAYEIFQVLDQDFTGDFTVDGSTFVVDSTNDRVGIGTSSPSSFNGGANNLVVGSGSGSEGMTIYADSASNSAIFFADGTSGSTAYTGQINYLHASDAMSFHTNGGTERMRIDSSGNVGIGTSSPSRNLHVENTSGNPVVAITSSTTGSAYLGLGDTANSLVSFIRQDNASGAMTVHAETSMLFTTSGSEAMRIDSSGNLMVGTTSYNADNTGFGVRGSDGLTYAARPNGQPLILNRKSSDGSIVSLRKDGVEVGSIGTLSSRLHIENGDTGLRIAGDLDQIFPCGSGGADRDAAIDLGSTGVRFKDLYLSGGVYLGGTGSANKLDDYEEGNFSMTLVGSSGNPTYTGGTNQAYYTKIGRLVHFYWYSGSISVSSAGSGDLRITGLPFTVDGNYSPISVAHNTIISGGATAGYFTLNSNYLYLQLDANRTNVISASSLTGGYIMISGTYIAA